MDGKEYYSLARGYFKRKDFTHHLKWFVDFNTRTYCIIIPERMHEYEYSFHYFKDEDKLYSISREDALAKRYIYRERPHVEKRFFAEIEITPKWREQIDAWEKSYFRKIKKEAEVQQIHRS